MPFHLPNEEFCINCAHGGCVLYIREQSKRMKDRDTLYRIRQNVGLSCAFDEWIPGFAGSLSGALPLIDYAEQIVGNARQAGRVLEQLTPNFFGDVEAPFVITPGQSGKVRGDVFEMLCRAILWNCASIIRGDHSEPFPKNFEVPDQLSALTASRNLAVLTLGDNYDLKNLLDKPSADRLGQLEANLKGQGTSIRYSTPDIVCIDISSHSQQVQTFFNKFIGSLDGVNQAKLANARLQLEGKVKPADIVFAGGIKTSIRSDRMYQFLYEANSWKFIWKQAFGIEPSAYYVLTSQTFGADPEKLASVDFSSLEGGVQHARRAIDGVYHVSTPDELITWFSNSVRENVELE